MTSLGLATISIVVAVAAILMPAPWTLMVAVLAAGGCSVATRFNLAVVAASLAAWAWVAVVLAIPLGWIWPIPPALALTGYLATTWRNPTLGYRTWFRIGHRDRAATYLAVASIPLTTTALAAFIASGRTDLESATKGLQGLHPVVIVLLGVGFALVNPFVEEALFRGLLQPALRNAGASVSVAIAAQATAFGAIHLDGVPGGPLGMLMAACWGAVLGIVRHRTNGLRLVWLVHVAANATIYTTITVLAYHRGLL